MSSSVLEVYSYNIAVTAWSGLLSLAALPLAFVATFMVHRRRDHARRGVIWLKLGFFLYAIAMVLSTVQSLLRNLMDFDVLTWRNGGTRVGESLPRISDASNFLLDLTDLSILLSIIDFLLGIGHCWAWSESSAAAPQKVPRSLETGLSRCIRWATYGLCGVLAVLALARFAMLESYISMQLDYAHSYRNTLVFSSAYVSLGLAIPRITAAFDIILLIMYLAVLALSIRTLVLANRSQPDHHKSSTLLLVATAMCCTAALVRVILVSIFTLNTAYSIEIMIGSRTWRLIVNMVLVLTPPFIALVVLFVLGLRKHDGIWSVQGGSHYGQYDHNEQHMVYNSNDEVRNEKDAKS
jgi:hypothetical protein